MAVRNLSDGNDEGQSLGLSTSDLISFYGVTPIAQRSGSAQVALSAFTFTQTSPFGFSSSAMALTVLAQLQEIRTTLVNLGFWAGA